MIKLKLSSIGNEKADFDLEIQNGEPLTNAIDRATAPLKLERHPAEVFQVLVNGHKIDAELWSFTLLREEDSVIIAPHIKSGDSGSIFKQFLLIAAVVAANIYTGGLVSAGTIGGLGAGLITAGVTIGASLLLNALIPPPVPSEGSAAGTYSYEKSQTYSLSGQSNSISRFGIVPKVYGKHKMFPTVAANPYIELEVDQKTKEVVQYLYCIYDFGLGPITVEDIKIGDTRLDSVSFSDYYSRLVDFNRPVNDEGFWDAPVSNNLLYYKGDVSSDPASVTLANNQYPSQDSGAIDEWRVIRSSALNTDGVDNQISLLFAFPRGLYAYSSTGELGSRSVDVQIEFKRVGDPESSFKNFNDLNEVKDFSLTGVDNAFAETSIDLYPPDTVGTVYPAPYHSAGTPGFYLPGLSYDTNGTSEIGIPKGRDYLIAKNGHAKLGDAISIQGEKVGIVNSISPYGASYSYYYFGALTKKEYKLFKYSWTLAQYGLYYYSPIDISVSGKATKTSPVPGRIRVTRSEPSACYSQVKFTPKVPGQYDIRITRVQTMSTFTTSVADEMVFLGVTTRFDRAPIVTDKRHTFLELKIRATNQLNGTIQNLSAVCTSVLDVYDNSLGYWYKTPTSNPAWIYTDILIGQINKRAVSKSKLHLPSIVEWATFCDQVPTSPPGWNYIMPRFTCNMVMDFDTTAQQLLTQVSSAAQASLNIFDGKYGVLIDKLKTTPIQVFTPRNSYGFSSSKVFSKEPNSIKVKYIDPSLNWKATELEVFDDGYTALNTVTTDEMLSFAVTNHEQAWRFGRYLLAQNRLRKETITISVDFENLVCTRGDYVQITQDVMKVGGSPARVKSVIGNRITIDDGLVTSGLISYGYVYRSVTGEIRTNTLTVVNSDTFDLSGTPIPSVGDLIIIGEVGFIVYDCIVKSINPNDNLTATLTLVEKADAIYSAESSSTIPAYDPKLSKTVDPNFAPPAEVGSLTVVDNAWKCTGNGYEYFIELDWTEPIGSSYETFEIYVDSGKGYNLVTTTRDSYYTYIISESRLDIPHNFKVLAVSASGKKLDLGSVGFVSSTPLKKTNPPSDVGSLNIDITGEVLQLYWPQVPDCDCSEYIIRYSALTSGTWEASIPLLRVDRNSTLASTQARTGTYLIKAVDFNGNESALAKEAITTIPNLFGLNVIETITDFPSLIGDQDRVESDGTAMTLKHTVVGGVESSEYYSEGYYYYTKLLDLGEIYTVRLQSQIQAEGFTLEDIMSNWVTLDSVLYMSNSKNAEWDVETQYRATESFNVMSEWTQLSLVDPISVGQVDKWTGWKKFIIGDATGRIFQFRLKLISNKTSVSPRVFDGTIKADMPDRIESYNNLTALDTGYTVTYSPAFKGPGTTPNVQVSIDNAQSGDYWVFNSKSLTGFNIQFFDKNNIAVARQFDVQIKGYGRKALAVI